MWEVAGWGGGRRVEYKDNNSIIVTIVIIVIIIREVIVNPFYNYIYKFIDKESTNYL